MSVRMALTKLCACACGGALIGGGAMHVTDHANHAAHYGAVRHSAVLTRHYSHPRLVPVLLWRIAPCSGSSGPRP